MPMLLRQIWRFVTLILAALLTGITFCHVLEMPAKMGYSAALYLTLHRTLYVAFGPPNVGVFVELGAILTSAVLVFLLRRRTGFWSTLVGAACLLVGLVVYFVFVEPANSALRAMAIEAAPQDWTAWRDQWEAGHSVRFGLDFLGLCALLLSVLPFRRPMRAPQPATQYQEIDRQILRSR